MVAFLNAKGRTLIIGINDETGDINGLTYKELQASNELLVNVASDNVKPQIFISTERVNVDGEFVIIVEKPESINKPHTDNSRGKLEVPIETIEELLVNALVHRNYFMLSTIKVFIFDNRVEIIRLGKLPNTLTVTNIKMGTSIARNPILYSNSRYLLPFECSGGGLLGAIEQFPELELTNDAERELFISTLKRNTTN